MTSYLVGAGNDNLVAGLVMTSYLAAPVMIRNGGDGNDLLDGGGGKIPCLMAMATMAL